MIVFFVVVDRFPSNMIDHERNN